MKYKRGLELHLLHISDMHIHSSVKPAYSGNQLVAIEIERWPDYTVEMTITV